MRPLIDAADRPVLRTCALAAAFLAGLLSGEAAHAGMVDDITPSSWAVNLGGITLHDRARSADGTPLSGINPGLGLEARWSDTWAATAGAYHNSQRHTSRYAAVLATPWRVDLPALGPLRLPPLYLGAIGGMVDGYSLHQGRAMPFIAPLAELRDERFAVAMTFIPSTEHLKNAASLAVMFKVRF